MPKYRAKKIDEVFAWKYDASSPLPVWVARKCHYLGDGKFTANSMVGVLPVDPGDYIIRVSEADDDVTVMVVTASDFEANYELIED